MRHELPERDARGVAPVGQHVAHVPRHRRVEIQHAALDELQWRWKSTLSREWYPHLFGLRHDLLLASGHQPALRIRKTQSAPLARVLLGHEITGGA